MPKTKSEYLDSLLKDLNPLAIAFSGGVDSSFLLFRAARIRKTGLIAITLKTPYMPAREIEEAKAFAGNHGINHKIIELSFPEEIRNNPGERCYLCKKRLFSELLSFTGQNGYKYLADGTNSDDSGDLRPGMKALAELGIRSPLREAGLTKKEIRDLALEAGLDIWDKPAMACLLTRIPFDTEVNDTVLRMIEKAEDVLFEMGYPGTRVRTHGELARIESLPGFIEKIVLNGEREKIIREFRNIGFRFISLDLEGYRSGSLNHEKNKQ